MTTDILDQRSCKRVQPENTFVLNQRCVCRVLNLSQRGMLFGCSEELAVPDKMAIDIIDNSGLEILNLPIEIIWSSKNNDIYVDSLYKMIVGVKFNIKKNSNQQAKIDQLLRLIDKNVS